MGKEEGGGKMIEYERRCRSRERSGATMEKGGAMRVKTLSMEVKITT